MQEALKNKISEAIQEPFVGNYIFTSDELNEIYQYIGLKLRYIAAERGEVLSPMDYDLVFVAMVNLAKEWISEEDAFFDYISKKLLGYLPLPGKIYNQIINAINKLTERKIFSLNSFTKKYYATICSHSFAPKSSIESFFDMCWDIYCNDLNQSYEENDNSVEMIITSLHNYFVGENNEDEPFQVGSQVYSFRAGIKGLVLDQQKMMKYLLNETIKTIDSLFNSVPIENGKYLYTLIKDWWMRKESLFGVKNKSYNKRDVVISDYSQIKPRYVLDDDSVVLSIPSIRLKSNIDIEPYLSLFTGDECIYETIMPLKGSGILMATVPINLNISKFKNISQLTMKITHCDKVIYDSKKCLERDFLLFKDEKEINNDECTLGTYILYCENLTKLYRYPKDIHKISFNTFSIETNVGDLIQTDKKTIFFVDEKCEREVYFHAKERQDLVYQYNNEEYKIIEGELYLHVNANVDTKDFGVRYEDAAFRLNEFKQEVAGMGNRFLLSALANSGEPQKISIFKYSDNSIVCSVSFVKFNSIVLIFDKNLYYGNNSVGNVEFICDGKNIKKQFNAKEDGLQVEYNEGKFLVKIPVFKWKIDENNWNYGHNNNGIWYKSINNTSTLYVDVPSDLTCEICVNNSFLEKGKNCYEYKLGQYIYAISMCENENNVIVYAKINNQLYKIITIYTKEQVISDPLYLNSESKELIWLSAYYVGDADVKFRIDLYNESKKITMILCDKTQKRIDLSQFCDGYYEVKLYSIDQGFLKREKLLFQKKIILGNEKNFKYNNKFFTIKSVMLFDSNEETEIKPIFIDAIKYLGTKDGFDYYSGCLFVKSIFEENKYLDYMKNEVGNLVRINPVRIEMRTYNSCYLGYGLEDLDGEFEYDSEFTLDYQKKTNIVTKLNGQRTKGIDYFLLEVKSV